MRRRMQGAWVLAVGLALGCAALARADDDEDKPAKTGNWFTRLFAKERPAKVKESKPDESVSPAPLSPALLRQKAYIEWQRRLEVCDKIRAIAEQTGDKDLSRKAEALDQRAWDVYLQRTGGQKGKLSPDEQILEGRLGLEASRRTKGPAQGGTADSVEFRAAARKE